MPPQGRTPWLSVKGAQANSGVGSTAIGEKGASTGSFTNATAIGNGAVATRDNQVVIGTASDTYTAPGITSAASRAAQSGPLQVVTTDANGNLASDGGRCTIFSARTISINRSPALIKTSDASTVVSRWRWHSAASICRNIRELQCTRIWV